VAAFKIEAACSSLQQRVKQKAKEAACRLACRKKKKAQVAEEGG